MHPGASRAFGGTNRRRVRGIALRLALALCVVLVVDVPGTMAAWTDPVPVTGSTIRTGTADLKVNNSDAPTLTTMNAATMEGGHSTAGVMTVRNAGDVPLTYYVDASATNTDGKGLASAFSVKVTADSATTGAAPNVRCAGSALSGSGTSFAANLVGSASNRRSLAPGSTETLCVQASLPDGTAALGGTTNVSFTFTAITGSTAVPGWTDTVVAGATLSMVTAFYLGTNLTADATADPNTQQPLRRTSPTKTVLYDYENKRDAEPGLLLNRGANGINDVSYAKNMRWDWAVGSTPVTVSGTARLRLWTALKAWDAVKIGSVQVGLFDCDAAGANCSQLSSATLTETPWSSGGTGVFALKNFVMSPAVSHTFAANRVVEVRVAPLNPTGSVDVNFAYDTTTYRTALIID